MSLSSGVVVPPALDHLEHGRRPVELARDGVAALAVGRGGERVARGVGEAGERVVVGVVGVGHGFSNAARSRSTVVRTAGASSASHAASRARAAVMRASAGRARTRVPKTEPSFTAETKSA